MQSKIEDRQSKILEWEVLPPEDRHRRKSVEPIFRWLALIMDDLLRLPGTKFRFGLDPLIGLLPGVGDTASAITSALVLFYATRSGLPKVLLARMAANILINEIIGIIPGLGDAFSFWFKSNRRNYELLKQYRAAPGRLRKGDWVFLVVLLGLLFAIVCAGMLVSLIMLRAIAKLISG
jgi:uncharacterized protein DUF4112